ISVSDTNHRGIIHQLGTNTISGPLILKWASPPSRTAESLDKVMEYSVTSPYQDEIRTFLAAHSSLGGALAKAMPYLEAIEGVTSVKLEFAPWDETRPLTIWVDVEDLANADDLETIIYEWWEQSG